MVNNIFDPIEPFGLRVKWRRIQDEAFESLRHIFITLEIDCLFCNSSQHGICWRCKRDEKKIKAMKAQLKEKKKQLKMNENNVRKRKAAEELEAKVEKDAKLRKKKKYPPQVSTFNL